MALAFPALAQSPEDAGLRWEHSSGDSGYIPGSVAFGAHDQHVWSAANFGSRRFTLFDAVGTNSSPRGESVLADTSLGNIEIAAASTGSAMFALEQHPSPNGVSQVTRIARYDVPSEVTGELMPTWTTDLTIPNSFTAKIATNSSGSTLAATIWNNSVTALALYDGVTGEMFASTGFSEQHPIALEVSDDGERIALAAGHEIWVLDPIMNVHYHRLFATAPDSLSLSADGHRVAVGFNGHAQIFQDSPTWHLAEFIQGDPHWVATHLDLNTDGETLALAWWNSLSGFDLRFEVRRGDGMPILFEHAQTGTDGVLQNLPQGARITANGARAAFGCWGALDPRPELLLVDVNSSQTVLEADLPGSVRGLALDESGTRVAVSLKETHANLVGYGGHVRLYDSGERDLQLEATPTIATGLRLWHRPPTMAHVTFLALGHPARRPLPLAGGTALDIERGTVRIFPWGSSSSSFEPRLELALHPALAGRTLAAQALYRTAGGWRASETSVEFVLP